MTFGFSAHSSKLVGGIPDKDSWYVAAWRSVEDCYWYFRQPISGSSMPIRPFEIPIYIGALKKPEVYSIRMGVRQDQVVPGGAVGIVVRIIPPVDSTLYDIFYVPESVK